jgi:hypothetical protein
MYDLRTLWYTIGLSPREKGKMFRELRKKAWLAVD